MSDEERPPTETARVASEVMDMLRIICAHAKGANNRPLKMTDLLDAILRPATNAMNDETIRRVTHDQTAKLTLPELIEVMVKHICHDHASKPKRKS